MKTIYFLFAALFIISLKLAGQTVETPNILLIMCDDLGWADVGFNGNQVIKTPHLDEMAGKGIVFNRFYSASPVCSPTRGSCLTGRHPFRYGIYNANSGHLKTEEITLPELLIEKGFVTGHFGKWHLGTLTTKIKDANRGQPGDTEHFSIPSMHGYDTWFATESKVPTFNPMVKPNVFDKSKGESLQFGWKATTENSESEFYGTWYWQGKETRVEQNLEGDDAEIIADRFIPFVEDALKKSKPFFATVWFHTPHLPVVADEFGMSGYSSFSHREQIYFATISAMDKQMGRIWKKLEELGITENTMIWFCSDNGPETDTPGNAGIFRDRKRSLYEGGVRVPAFLVWPKVVQAGQHSNFPAVTSDYLPTILEILKIPYPSERPLDGISLANVLKGNHGKREKPIGFLFQEKQSWMNHEYKLISTNEGKNYELYNLLNDPAEKKNIISEFPDLAIKMKSDLLEWISSLRNSNLEKDY